MKQPNELRQLAERYRDWAAVAELSDKAWREGFADYLEHRAADLEQRDSRQE